MKPLFAPLCCLTLFGLAAQAQEAPSAPQATPVREACAADLKKFCPDVQPGGGRIRACIAEHRDDLSPGCRDALQQARAHRQQPANPGPAAQPPSPKPQQ
jgi:cysteine rich repeat protein